MTGSQRSSLKLLGKKRLETHQNQDIKSKTLHNCKNNQKIVYYFKNEQKIIYQKFFFEGGGVVIKGVYFAWKRISSSFYIMNYQYNKLRTVYLVQCVSDDFNIHLIKILFRNTIKEVRSCKCILIISLNTFNRAFFNNRST